MNFPLEQPLFQFFYWLVNTPGLGAVIIGLVVGAAILLFVTTLRWIRAAKDLSPETFLIPPHE